MICLKSYRKILFMNKKTYLKISINLFKKNNQYINISIDLSDKFFSIFIPNSNFSIY